MFPRSVTIDTNVVPIGDLEASAARRGVSIAISTVTDRELDVADSRTQGLHREPDVAVWNESRWGQALGADEKRSDQLERILRIISSGAFPRPEHRDNLTDGQRNQLRDAMAFQAHLLSGRDAFVTTDIKGFVAGDRRKLLEELGSTRILTREEFVSLLRSA